MKASNILIDKLKQFEGYRGKAYRCAAGVWTLEAVLGYDFKAGYPQMVSVVV